MSSSRKSVTKKTHKITTPTPVCVTPAVRVREAQTRPVPAKKVVAQPVPLPLAIPACAIKG